MFTMYTNVRTTRLGAILSIKILILHQIGKIVPQKQPLGLRGSVSRIHNFFKLNFYKNCFLFFCIHPLDLSYPLFATFSPTHHPSTHHSGDLLMKGNCLHLFFYKRNTFFPEAQFC